MKYIFEIDVYTDGDFCLPFVPSGMSYDDDYTYTFVKEYNDRDVAIKDIIDICDFLRNHMHTSREYVKRDWNECIGKFVRRLEEVGDDLYQNVEAYMSGNYEGTGFRFKQCVQYVNIGFAVTDDEYETIRGRGDITTEMVKAAVMNLYES